MSMHIGIGMDMVPEIDKTGFSRYQVMGRKYQKADYAMFFSKSRFLSNTL